MRPERTSARREPPACSQIADEVSGAAAHQGHQRLCPRAPCGVHALVEVDLRRDENEREGTSVQHHAREQPHFAVDRTQCESQDAEAEAAGENPFQPHSQEQPAQHEHGNDFRDLSEAHPCAGVGQAEFPQMRRRVRIKSRKRNREQCRRNKDHPMVGIFQQHQCVQSQTLAQCLVFREFWRLQCRQEKRERADQQPHHRAAVAGQH